jgi:plastocyanin
MRTKLSTLFVAAVLAVCLALPAETAQAATLVKAGGNSACNRFKPAGVTIHKGARVVWRSTCGDHTVTAYSHNWSKNTVINEGASTGRTFKTKGVFKYYCKNHGFVVNGSCSGMCGKVTVTT